MTRWVSMTPKEPVALGAAMPDGGEVMLLLSQWLVCRLSGATGGAGPQTEIVEVAGL